MRQGETRGLKETDGIYPTPIFAAWAIPFEFIGARAGQDRVKNLRLGRSWVGARARCYGQIFMTPHNCIKAIACKKFICSLVCSNQLNIK